ncbi:MAG: class I SAM-dependent DNA methyltransferase [bacterium]
MNHSGNHIEARLWEAADELRANSKLKSSEYSVPVLGLVFLRYADYKFQAAAKELEGTSSGRRIIGPADYQAKGVLYLPETARFSTLIRLPEGANIGAAINDAMRAIEAENPDLTDVLPKTYNRFENALLKELLKTMNSVPMDIEGDAFGKIYEYFLGHFAMSEGQKGGEFFTPTAIVQLLVAIIQPFHGRICDLANGSGGMFVQSARFVEAHKSNPSAEISIYGQERVAETVRLCKMNLAVHGLAGDIRQGNTYYEDLHKIIGKFDFHLANPPFNVDRVDKDRLKDDPRFPFGLPRTDNANYLWIQLFYSSLNETGRAGFVMANSASDARGSELEIRKQLIEARAVDVMVAVGANFFYTVTLPCTLWFFDRGKSKTAALEPGTATPKPGSETVPGTIGFPGTAAPQCGISWTEAVPGTAAPQCGKTNVPRAYTVLFIDARHLFRQIDRAHRDWTPAQIEFLANIARLYRGEEPENLHDSAGLVAEHFPDSQYADVPGLCKVATLAEIEAQGYSLNPGRYVGVTVRAEDDFDFKARLQEQNEELETLNAEARELEDRIAENVAKLLEGE